MVGWYNSLVRDLGDAADNNAVVVKIREAAQSQLRDENITPTAGAPVWLLTLKNWSITQCTIGRTIHRCIHAVE